MTLRSKLYTVADAAAYLSLSEAYLYQLTSEGRIPYHKSRGGKRVYFLEEDLRAWALHRRVDDAQEEGGAE